MSDPGFQVQSVDGRDTVSGFSALPTPCSHGRGRRFLFGGVVVVVAGAIGTLGFLAWSNYDRADDWQTRAGRLELNARQLNALLVERSARLNARTRELNSMANKVRAAKQTIARSEADVSALERRQRELANEKAQVEDARAQLAAERDVIGGVASAYISCKNGLIDIIDYIANDDYDSANYYWSTVSTDCTDAETSLQDYLSVYGG